MDDLGTPTLGLLDGGQLEGIWRSHADVEFGDLEPITATVREFQDVDDQHEEFVTQFQRLVNTSQQPRIIRPLAVGQTDEGHSFAVWPSQTAPTLADMLAPLSAARWQNIVTIVRDIAELLVPLHDAQLPHGHISPAAIHLPDQEPALLGQFGLGAVAEEGELIEQFTGEDGQGAFIAYRGPEIVDGVQPSVASDVYGLGSTLWSALAGTVPFIDSDTDMGSLANSIRTSMPTPLGDPVPPGVESVIVRAMAKEPSDRFFDAREFLAALDEAVAKVRPARVQPAFVPSVSAGAGPRLGLAPKVAVAAALLIGATTAYAVANPFEGDSNKSPSVSVGGVTTLRETTTVAPTTESTTTTEASTTDPPTSDSTTTSSDITTTEVVVTVSTTVPPTTGVPTTVRRVTTTKPRVTAAPTTAPPTTAPPTTAAPTTAPPITFGTVAPSEPG